MITVNLRVEQIAVLSDFLQWYSDIQKKTWKKQMVAYIRVGIFPGDATKIQRGRRL